MRIIWNLNQDWRFIQKDAGLPDTLPEDWERIDLPHTWNAVDGHDGNGSYDRGKYWYAKSFTVPKQPLAGGRVYIEVLAAGQQASVYVNGKEAVYHEGGYSDSEEYQALYHEHMAKVLDERPWIWSSHVWNMFDFGCAARSEGGVAGRNNKGLVTMDRKTKKDSYYIYQAYWGSQPMLHLCGRRYAQRAGGTTQIRVYSNQSSVALYINGRDRQMPAGDGYRGRGSEAGDEYAGSSGRRHVGYVKGHDTGDNLQYGRVAGAGRIFGKPECEADSD